MRGVQGKINKLVLALKSKGIIVFIDTEQFYSVKFKKTCNKFIVKLDDEKSLECRKELRTKQLRLKDIVSRMKKNSKRHKKFKEILKEMNIELRASYPHKNEITSKLNVLLFLVDTYKEVV